MGKIFANKVVDFALYMMDSKKKYQEKDNITSVNLPELSAADSEISGAGLPGTINRPDFAQMEAPECTITGRRFINSIRGALAPNNGVKIKVNWAVDYITSSGETKYDSYTAYVYGWPKTVPGPEITKGEGTELEMTIAVKYYKLIQNGETLVEYNPLANVVKINGTDVLAGARKAMGKK